MPTKAIQNYLALVIGAGLLLSAGCSTTDPLPVRQGPVSCQHLVRSDPNFSIFVVKINLADPRVSVRVSPGGTVPDHNGPWVTTLLPTSEIAARDGYDIAINGDFFEAKATKDLEGKNAGYVKGKPAAPVGMAMTDGRLWHQAKEQPQAEPFLEITTTNTAIIVAGRTNQPIDYYARQMVGGSQIIVSNGMPVEYHSAFATNRHPRTVVGVGQGGTELTLLVVDGRQPSLSIGMTLAELSKEMIRLGCDNAINLDGGGSTTLVYREAGDERLKILNSPSDTKERSVADVLEVKFDGPLPEPK